MEFDLTELTNKSYIWNTFSKVSQDTSLIMRMNCTQKSGNTETRVNKTVLELLMYFYMVT